MKLGSCSIDPLWAGRQHQYLYDNTKLDQKWVCGKIQFQYSDGFEYFQKILFEEYFQF